MVSIILLYFQSSPYMLFTVSSTIKIIISYLNIFIDLKLDDILPANIFQITGMTIYIIFSLSILYNLMFDQINPLESKTKKKQNETEISNIIHKLSRLNLKDIDAMMRIAGILLISINQEQKAILTDNDRWLNFGFDVIGDILSVIFAMIIGYILSIKFTLNSNLLFSSITFLLMGIDIAVKFFSG